MGILRPSTAQVAASGIVPTGGGDVIYLPSGNIGADTTQTDLASITLDASNIDDALSYIWSVICDEDGTYTSSAAPAAPTSSSTTLTPDGPGVYTIICTATNANGSSVFKRKVIVSRPLPIIGSLSDTSVTTTGTVSLSLSDTNSADTVSWSTTATRIDTGGSVSITGGTSTSPSATKLLTTSIHFAVTATDIYGRYDRKHVITEGRITSLVPGSNPSTQELSPGTTTSSTITFSNPTGGSGSYTHALTLIKPTGSTASLSSSSGLTTTVTSMVDGGSYVVYDTITDTNSGDTCRNVCFVRVSVHGVITAGSNPAIQSLAANTNTSGTITFNAPSNGSGTYTHALTLIKIPTNTTGALSASNTLGPVTLGSIANGSAYTVVCTSTDTLTGYTCKAMTLITQAIPTISFSNPTPQVTSTAGTGSVTFTTATGGTGTLTLGTATLSKPVDSSATISGSGYGAYTFTMDLPGTYSVSLSVEDELGISVIATGLVTYTPLGPTWSVLETLDFASCDNLTATSGSTFALTVSGVAYKTLNIYTSGSLASPTWTCTNGSGIKVSQGASTGELFFDWVPPTPTAGKKVLAQFVVGTPTYTGTGDISVIGRLTNAASWNGGACLSSLVYIVKPGNYRMKTVFHSASIPSESTVRDNAADITWPACVSIIHNGTQFTLIVHQNVSGFVNPDSLGTGSVMEHWQAIQSTPSTTYTRTLSSIRMAYGHLDAIGSTPFCSKARLLEASRL